MKKLIIFDLDGTLIDTSTGIFNSVRYAEKAMGLLPIPDSMLKAFVGPPPKEMYKKIHNISDELALQAAKKHREYGKTKAIYESKLYPEVQETLERLKSLGCKLAVATLKSKPIADTVLKLHNIYNLFDAVVGMDEKESLTKKDTIDLAQQLTGIYKNSLMIGDSTYDFDGALEAKIEFLGVLYGFGFERKQKYSFDTVNNFSDIYNYVISK